MLVFWGVLYLYMLQTVKSELHGMPRRLSKQPTQNLLMPALVTISGGWEEECYQATTHEVVLGRPYIPSGTRSSKTHISILYVNINAE